MSSLVRRIWCCCKIRTKMVRFLSFHPRFCKRTIPTKLLLTFPIITFEGVVSNLTLRLESTQLYSNIGHVLIACNPYKWLDIYGEDSIKRYIHQQRVDVEPHVFATAEAAYRYQCNHLSNIDQILYPNTSPLLSLLVSFSNLTI